MPYSGHFSQRIDERQVIAKTNDFGFDGGLADAVDQDDGTHGRREARDGGGKPLGADDAADHRGR